MKKSTLRNIRMGFFIVLGLLLFILAIYYLGSKQNLFGSRFEVSAKFKNVKGLRVGSNVMLAGINVGNVESIHIINDSTIKVDLLLDEDINRFIKKDSKVSIGSAGLLGDKSVYITYGSPQAEPVEPGGTLPTDPSATMDDIFSSIKETSKKTNQIADELATLLNTINKGKGDLGKLLHDTVLYYQLTSATGNLMAATEEVDQISSNISDISYKINEGDGDLARLINDTLITAQFSETLHEMDTATIHLKKFSKDLNQSRGLLHKVIKDTSFAREVDSSVSNFNQAAKTISGKLGKLKDNWLVNLFFEVDEDEKEEDKANTESN